MRPILESAEQPGCTGSGNEDVPAETPGRNCVARLRGDARTRAWHRAALPQARPDGPATLGTVDRQDATAGIRDVRICGSQLVLRPLRPREIDEEWQAMVTADPMVIADLPDEASFKARLQRSGHLEHGWLDLAIDLGGVSIGRIQTFVPLAVRSPRAPSRWGSACGKRTWQGLRARGARAPHELAFRACGG